MSIRFEKPTYPATLANGEKVTIDVTNSISAGLGANSGLLEHLVPWMQERGYSRILDFGAGALRHTLPLLESGFEVTAVEYEVAFKRPKAGEARQEAESHDGFTALVWPHDFLKSKVRYHVALLIFVLQTIPVKLERKIVLDAIAKKFDPNGPKRLFYASRFGEAQGLPAHTRYNDGWVRGRGAKDRSFYTEWNAAQTNKLFSQSGYDRQGSYGGASQPFIYDVAKGIL